MLASLGGYLIPMLANLIITPLLLRALGEAAYGLQSLVGVIIGYLSIMDMGLDLPIIKYLAEDQALGDIESRNHLLSTTLQIYGLIGLAGMVSIMLLSDLFAQQVFKIPPDLVGQARWVFYLAGIGFLGSVIMFWGRAVAMGTQRYDVTYAVSVTTSVSGAALGLGAVYLGYGVAGYVAVRVSMNFLAFPAYWLVLPRILPQFRFLWGLHKDTLKRVAGYVGYGSINRVLSALVSRLDQTLLGIWLGVAAVGIYSIPFLVVSSLGYMIAYMLGFFTPMASELQILGQKERLGDFFIRATRFITALANMSYVPLLMLGDLFLTLWVGPKVSTQAAWVLRLLLLSGYIGTLTASLTNNYLVGAGYMRQFTIYATIRALLLGAGCALFIRPWGLEGAALAWLVAEVINIFYLLIVLQRFLKISPLTMLRKAYMRPMALGLVLAMLAYFARPFAISWIKLVMVGLGLELFYIMVSFQIGVFGKTEKETLFWLWERIASPIYKQN